MSIDQRTIPISEAIELFLLDCKARRLTKASIKFYTSKLQKFVDWFDGESLHEINSTNCKRFMVSNQDYSSKYQHNLARALKTFLKFCHAEGLMGEVTFPMPRLEKKILPAFTKTEVRAIVTACERERDKAIVYTLLDTGLRASELCGLRVEDFDSNGTITVHLGKGQKSRVVPISSKTVKVIKKFLLGKDTEALFPSDKGGSLTPNGLAQLMDRLRQRTGIEHLTAHTFRRTFAIECLRNGMNVHVLAKIMGHSDIQVLKQYLDLVEDDLISAHLQASPVSNLF